MKQPRRTETMSLKHILGDMPVINMLDFFIENVETDFTRAEIAHYANVGPTAMKANFRCLTQCGVVVETRKIGGVPLYAIDMTNRATELLIKFDEDLTDYCTDMILDADATIGDMQEAEDARDRFMAGPDYTSGPEPERTADEEEIYAKGGPSTDE